MSEYAKPYRWRLGSVAPAALVPLAQFSVGTNLPRDELLANLSRGQNNFRDDGSGYISWSPYFLEFIPVDAIITGRDQLPRVPVTFQDQPPRAPRPMVIFGLDRPTELSSIDADWYNHIDPAVRQQMCRERDARLAERYPVTADAVVTAIRRQEFRPATFCELLALAVHHSLTPQAALVGWSGGEVNIHALGSCTYEECGDQVMRTEYRYPTVAISRDITVGRPFLFHLTENGDNADDHRGMMYFGRDFFLAVPVNQ